LNGGKVELNRLSTEVQNEKRGTKANEINANAQARLKHTRALEEETELRDYPPVSPQAEIELVEGTPEGDDFTIPRRKPGTPIPGSWSPESANLSENVANLISEWPEGEYERECVKFVEDANANDRRHRNWDRALGVWLTKHDGYLQQRGRRHERASGWTNR
jgi:hypothetical protein